MCETASLQVTGVPMAAAIYRPDQTSLFVCASVCSTWYLVMVDAATDSRNTETGCVYRLVAILDHLDILLLVVL